MQASQDTTTADEFLAICDARGRPLPAGRPRGLVHREGLWHRSFHCWIVRADQRGPALILQRRARTKDTHPGAWDVSAAGHYRPGEAIAGGLRELTEELGLVAPAEALVWVERHREVIRYPDGLWDREYQDVYLLRCDQPLDAYVPDPAEVDAVAALPVATLAALARGTVRHARAQGWLLSAAGWREESVILARGRLVPRAGRYYERVARAAARLVGSPSPAAERRVSRGDAERRH